MPERLGFGTAAYSKGLLVGETVPVALSFPVVLPFVSQDWHPAFAIWATRGVVLVATRQDADLRLRELEITWIRRISGDVRGPVGVIGVKLRPEAAASLLGERTQCFLDAEISLDAIFGANAVSLLEERLAEATTSAERFACVERFLAANLRARHVKPVACQAAALLRENPNLRVRHLAARLDVSERHLSRSFQAMFGMGPKRFARIARIERVWSAEAIWADIAYATGFTDQAHMINDFTEIVGVPPAQLLRPQCS